MILPGDAGYEEARRVFNMGRAGRPAVIARPRGVVEVQQALAEARARGLPVAVRAGGHSLGGFGASDGAMVIDLRQMDETTVYPGEVTVGGGLLAGELLERLEPLGVATPLGFDTRLGVAGLALGGGYGVLTRAHGLACDNLLRAEVVLASGAHVSTNETLLWALRGAGANFGVVTSLTFRLLPTPRVATATLRYPLARAAEVLRAARDVLATLGDATTLNAGLYCLGDGVIALMAFHLGAPDELRAALAPLARLGVPEDGAVEEVPYRAVHAAGGETFPEGHAHQWGADFVRHLDDALLDTLCAHALRARGEDLWIVLEHLGGAMSRVAAGATAFPHRDAGFGVVSTVKWRDTAPARALDAQASLHQDIRPFSIGRYVNYVGPGADLDAVYGANLRRLRALKQRFDPENFFRANVNIV